MSLKLWYKKVFRNLHKYPVVGIVKCIVKCREHPLVYNHVLAETGHLTCFVKEFLNDLFEQNVLNEINFPCPDGCFVISSYPATCLDTVKLRQNPHENHVTLDFVKAMDRHLSKYLNESSMNIRYSVVDQTSEWELLNEFEEFLADIRM